jgi:hypothetical protein
MSSLPDRRAALALALVAAVLGCDRAANSAQRADSPQVAPASSPAAEAPILTSLRAVFQRENPRLERVGVLDWQSVGDAGAVYVGKAVPASRQIASAQDEMFGVFHMPRGDTALRTLLLFPTPSQGDYTMRLERIDPDSIVVRGSTSYSHDFRVVRWEGAGVTPYARPEDPWDSVTVAFSDTLEMNLFDQPDGNRVPIDLRFQGHLRLWNARARGTRQLVQGGGLVAVVPWM